MERRRMLGRIARVAALAGVVTVAVVALVMSPAWRTSRRAAVSNAVQIAADIESFRQRYGPGHYSEHAEEWLIRDHFQDRREGFFVDVGANHYRRASKTYYLESMLGWSGLAIEPQGEFAAGYARYRPRTRFAPFFVSDVSNETARLYVIKAMGLVASSNEAFVKSFGDADEVRDVPTITLNDLLTAEGIRQIDFLSIDIELHEPQALKGFDIARFKPALVCIEALLPVRQQILDYFAAHRYVAVGKYLWVDAENLYFVPLDEAKAEGP